ncbi:MAG: LPS assembly lipoprotein LptE [Thiohalomonadales bacterium]
MIQSSCGFRLRGALEISPEYLPIAITSAGGHIKLTSVLIQRLKGAGLSIVDPDVATSVLLLESERNVKELVTVATSGESQTYGLNYTIQFSIRKTASMPDIQKREEPHSNQENEVIVQVVTVTRSFQFEKSAVLSSSSEETIIKKEMLVDAAEQIVRRLNELGGKDLVEEPVPTPPVNSPAKADINQPTTSPSAVSPPATSPPLETQFNNIIP